jgi:hypothetical protein
MRLTMTDKTEIKQIIASLSDDDHAKIEEVDAVREYAAGAQHAGVTSQMTTRKQQSNGLVKTTAIIRNSLARLCGTYSDRA